MASKQRAPLWAAFAVAVVCAAFHLWLHRMIPERRSDFDQVWFAARSLLAGRDPYTLIGPGRAFRQPWPFYYPLPAAVVAVPVAWLPVEWARAIIAALCGGIFAYAVVGAGRAPSFALVSAPFGVAIANGQFAPLIAAGALLPMVGGIASVKPNIGLVALAGARTWTALIPALIIAALLCAISFAVQPSWFASWVEATTAAPHFAPYIVRPFGVLLVLALVRWRRPDARALLASAIVPGTPSIYDALVPLALTLVYSRPSYRMGALLAVLSMAALPIAQLRTPAGATFTERVSTAATVDLWLIMVPCLLLVLRSRTQDDRQQNPQATAAVGEREAEGRCSAT